MIIITEKEFFSEGKSRKCYIHPQNRNLCIKVIKASCENTNFLEDEIKYYRKIQERNKNYTLTFFSHYRGTIETNLGIGYLYDIIRDHDGKISLSLKSYIETRAIKEFPNSLSKVALSNLMDKMVKYRVFGYDVYHHNLLCRLVNNNEIELVLVDGLGIKVKSSSIRSRFAFLVDYSESIARTRVESLFLPLSKILSDSEKKTNI